MPRAIAIPPPLNTADIPAEGAMVTITDVRIVTAQWTSIGTVTRGLGFNVEYKGNKYSQLFSIDREVLTGSVGRLLVSIGIEDTDAKGFAEKVKAFIGKSIKVVKKGGKLYWYP